MTWTDKRQLIRRAVDLPRNSRCNSAAIDRLDFTRWHTDGGTIHDLYLHVPRKQEDGTTHRVFPRAIAGYACRRLEMTKTRLYWLYDKEKP